MSLAFPFPNPQNFVFVYVGFMLFPNTEATCLQDQISRLNNENGSLKQNLTSTNTALKEARTDLSRASNNNAIKVDTFYYLVLLYSSNLIVQDECNMLCSCNGILYWMKLMLLVITDNEVKVSNIRLTCSLLQGNSDHSPNRSQKSPTNWKSRNHLNNGIASKQNGTENDTESHRKEKVYLFYNLPFS